MLWSWEGHGLIFEGEWNRYVFLREENEVGEGRK